MLASTPFSSTTSARRVLKNSTMFFFFFLFMSAIFSALAAPIEIRQNCPDVSVFFARGTGELGTIGTVVGPRLRSALQRSLSGQTVEFIGINYAANVAGFIAGGDAQGATTMANSVAVKATTCPDTKIAISGYSQGAKVVHLAASKLSPAVQQRVNAAVVFGDPLDGTAFPGGIASKTFCANGDNICDGGFIITAAHLSYGANAGEAAGFIASRTTNI